LLHSHKKWSDMCNLYIGTWLSQNILHFLHLQSDHNVRNVPFWCQIWYKIQVLGDKSTKYCSKHVKKNSIVSICYWLKRLSWKSLHFLHVQRDHDVRNVHFWSQIWFIILALGDKSTKYCFIHIKRNFNIGIFCVLKQLSCKICIFAPMMVLFCQCIRNVPFWCQFLYIIQLLGHKSSKCCSIHDISDPNYTSVIFGLGSCEIVCIFLEQDHNVRSVPFHVILCT